MKQLCLSLLLLSVMATPALAQTTTPSASPTPTATSSGTVKGDSDDPFASEYSDSATISALATPIPRAVTYSTASTPVSGAVENTIMLLAGGGALIFLGFRFSRE